MTDDRKTKSVERLAVLTRLVPPARDRMASGSLHPCVDPRAADAGETSR